MIHSSACMLFWVPQRQKRLAHHFLSNLYVNDIAVLDFCVADPGLGIQPFAVNISQHVFPRQHVESF